MHGTRTKLALSQFRRASIAWSHLTRVQLFCTASLVHAASRSAASRSAAVQRAATCYVGVSGGVDSSVTALLLQQQGHRVVGVHMRNWDESDEVGDAVCPHTAELKVARKVCEQLGIPLLEVDFVQDYWNDVFERFVAGHQRGTTPNPDVLCNSEIKFKRFVDFALADGADFVATGHYARVQRRESGAPLQLFSGCDIDKDQSYFLAGIDRAVLERIKFPLGAMQKRAVRALATAHGLCTATQRDSQGICFIGKRQLSEFLPQYVAMRPGRFVALGNDDAAPVGASDAREVVAQKHRGIGMYTIGQRAAIGGSAQPWYVVDKSVEANEIVVAKGKNHPALYRTSLDVERAEFNWLCADAEAAIVRGEALRCSYRVRYRQSLGTCTVAALPEAGTAARLRIEFDQPQRAVTPGQTVALWDEHGGQCLGGGSILPGEPLLREQSERDASGALTRTRSTATTRSSAVR